MLSHAAEDSSLLIYKTSDGKVTRTTYNLHKTHCSLPGVPSSLSVPWVPLDPGLLLPYHIHHGRIPCTFPPKSLGPTAQQKVRSFSKLNVPLGCLLLIYFTGYILFQLDVHIHHISHNITVKTLSIERIGKVVCSPEFSYYVRETFYFCKLYKSTRENSPSLPSEA